MLNRNLFPTLIVAAAAISLGSGGGGCTSKQKPVHVTLENQSSAELEVQVDLPVRGPMAKKPNHEAYRTLLPPGATWTNSRDTLRVGAEPNSVKGFRVMVADISRGMGQTERVWYRPFPVEGSRKNMHVVFDGEPGALKWRTPGGAEREMELYQFTTMAGQ